ncbi:hypothetical protein C0J52_00925 [Blattella germanica]|nr:hypothetical protein C0J52_00925 [Blattella germanica]
MGRTASVTGVSRSKIYRVNNEKKKECSTPRAPGKQLYETLLSTVSAEDWKNVCDHVEKYVRFYWEQDVLLDELTDNYKCRRLRHREWRK